MMPQTEATNLLCAAQRTLGIDKLREMLPAPFVLHQIADHSTGRHVYIAAKADGLPWTHVWGGSVWYSRQYLFNDDINPPGIQKGCGWATKPLSDYFDAVKVAHAEAVRIRDEKRAAMAIQAAAERRDIAAKYAAIAGVEA